MDREIAVQALADRLDTISVTNGYAMDMGQPVSRLLTTIEDISDGEMPALIIEDNGEGGEDIQELIGGTADVYFTIPVIGYVHDATNPTTAINAMDKAVKRAVLSDPTLGGAVNHASVQPLIGRSGSEGAPYGWFIRPIRIYYEGLAATGF